MYVTVAMPLQQATLAGAATTPGFALDYTFANKVRGSEEECRAQGIAFLPIVAESLGGWHSALQCGREGGEEAGSSLGQAHGTGGG